MTLNIPMEMATLNRPLAGRTRPSSEDDTLVLCRACGAAGGTVDDSCSCCGMAGSLEAVPSQGQIYSYTIVHPPRSGQQEDASYVLALVRLADGRLLMAQLLHTEMTELGIGLRVELALDDDAFRFERPGAFYFTPQAVRRTKLEV